MILHLLADYSSMLGDYNILHRRFVLLSLLLRRLRLLTLEDARFTVYGVGERWEMEITFVSMVCKGNQLNTMEGRS